MKPGEKIKNPSGNEIILFPMEYMMTSQGPHREEAWDFLGWNANGRVNNCPCYAPFSGSVVYTGNDHNMIYWSDEKVQFVDGTIDYASILVAHSETAPTIGAKYSQGDLWYHTGNYGMSTGDHLHIELAKGHVKWNRGGTGLLNPLYLPNGMYVNDTIIVNGGGATWVNYDVVPPTPEVKKRKKFPWVLYAKKLRNKY